MVGGGGEKGGGVREGEVVGGGGEKGGRGKRERRGGRDKGVRER